MSGMEMEDEWDGDYRWKMRVIMEKRALGRHRSE